MQKIEHSGEQTQEENSDSRITEPMNQQKLYHITIG
jgi:hypothetical protein